jgi:hypothetical protein
MSDGVRRNEQIARIGSVKTEKPCRLFKHPLQKDRRLSSQKPVFLISALIVEQ